MKCFPLWNKNFTAKIKYKNEIHSKNKILHSKFTVEIKYFTLHCRNTPYLLHKTKHIL